jgi:type IV pilus assembly protein PilQ
MEKPCVWIKRQPVITCTLLAVLLASSLLPVGAQTTVYPPSSKTIQLYLKQTEARDAFNLLSKASGQNLVVNNQLNGQVSLKLQDVSFEDALNALCLALGTTYEKVGGVYVISQPSDEKPMPFLPSYPVAAHSNSDPGKRLVTLNVKNGDLSTILQQLANQAGVEIVIFGRISGQETVRLQSMPFEEALKTVLAGSKLSYLRDGNRFLVGEPNNTNGMVQQLSQSEMIELNNTTAKDFMEMLPPEFDASQIKINEERNALIVTGVKQFISKVREYARQVDVAQPQVALDINIVELSKNGRDQLTLLAPEIRWDFVKKVERMQFTLINQAITSLITDGRATIKARPSISTISGRKAKINITDDLNFVLTAAVGTGGGTTITSNLQTINAGTVLEVTPTVGRDGLIHTDLNIEVSGVSSFTAGLNGTQIPNVRRRQAQTSVNVLDGETILIAGLTQSQDRVSYTKVPLLGKIPLLGDWAASHDNRKDQSELVIFVTPHLIEAKTQANPAPVIPLQASPVASRKQKHPPVSAKP